MSSLKTLTQAPTDNVIGRLSYDTKQTSAGYLKCDGSILLQAAYPALFAQVGLLPPYTYNTATQFALPSSIPITYGSANNQYIIGS